MKRKHVVPDEHVQSSSMPAIGITVECSKSASSSSSTPPSIRPSTTSGDSEHIYTKTGKEAIVGSSANPTTLVYRSDERGFSQLTNFMTLLQPDLHDLISIISPLARNTVPQSPLNEAIDALKELNHAVVIDEDMYSVECILNPLINLTKILLAPPGQVYRLNLETATSSLRIPTTYQTPGRALRSGSTGSRYSFVSPLNAVVSEGTKGVSAEYYAALVACLRVVERATSAMHVLNHCLYSPGSNSLLAGTSHEYCCRACSKLLAEKSQSSISSSARYEVMSSLTLGDTTIQFSNVSNIVKPILGKLIPL